MKYWLGVTDNGWFDFLSHKQPDEVNFWQPSGLLLRSDFHKLFDLGLVTVTPELSIEISPQIREEWLNGRVYYRLHGQRLANVPSKPAHRPASDFLRWHNENRFQG